MIDVGEGHNTLNYTNSSAAQKMDIVGGSGEDDMNFIADYGADNWTVKAGNGDNVIRALGMIVGNVASFSTGVGSDNVQLKSSWLGTLEVYTGDGDDRVASGLHQPGTRFCRIGAKDQTVFLPWE